MSGTLDVHAHAVLGDLFGAAGAAGPELGQDPDGTPWYRVGGYTLRGVRYRGSAFMDPELRVRRMDESGIDVQVVSPNPLTYFYDLAPELGVEYSRRHNELLVEQVLRRYPKRLRGFAQLPMQDVAAACRELERSVRELGLLGPYIGSDLPIRLDHPGMDEFYATCVALDVPLMIHPANPGPGPRVVDERLQRFDLELLWGFAYEETLATATLVFGGVLERHPRLDVCISHGGGAAAFMYGRLEEAARKRAWAPGWLSAEDGFARQFDRLWFDSVVHSPRSLDFLLETAAPGHVVLGTNFAGWDQGPVATLGERALELSANARALLRLHE